MPGRISVDTVLPVSLVSFITRNSGVLKIHCIFSIPTVLMFDLNESSVCSVNFSTYFTSRSRSHNQDQGVIRRTKSSCCVCRSVPQRAGYSDPGRTYQQPGSGEY